MEEGNMAVGINKTSLEITEHIINRVKHIFWPIG